MEKDFDHLFERRIFSLGECNLSLKEEGEVLGWLSISMDTCKSYGTSVSDIFVDLREYLRIVDEFG